MRKGNRARIYNGLQIKGIPLPASMEKAGIRYSLSGSMTVEAAFVMPIFLFFFLNLMSAVEMVRLHGNLELALWEHGRALAVSGYICEAAEQNLKEDWQDSIPVQLGGKLLTDWAVKSAILQELGEGYLDKSPLTSGSDSLNLTESSYMENDCIDIKVTYQVSAMFRIPGVSSFRMANRYYARAWTGYQVWEEEDSDADASDIVYVTEYGEVYHVTPDCSYLKRVIRKVTMQEVMKECNSAGEHYTECLLCSQSDSEGSVYIMSGGNRYHITLECPAVKRNVRTMERKQAEQHFRPCSRCSVK